MDAKSKALHEALKPFYHREDDRLRLVSIMRANLDVNLQPLEGMPESKPIAHLVNNLANGLSSNSSETVKNILTIGSPGYRADIKRCQGKKYPHRSDRRKRRRNLDGLEGGDMSFALSHGGSLVLRGSKILRKLPGSKPLPIVGGDKSSQEILEQLMELHKSGAIDLVKIFSGNSKDNAAHIVATQGPCDDKFEVIFWQEEAEKWLRESKRKAKKKEAAKERRSQILDDLNGKFRAHVGCKDIKVEPLKYKGGELGLVFYVEPAFNDWDRKIEFDKPQVLQVVLDNNLDVIEFLNFVLIEAKYIGSNGYMAISDPDQIAEFFQSHGIEWEGEAAR